ncbi:Sad1 / UNC-like protein [Nitzschia inconspicua]|uniref:Sad1 / UNC-like protein n=1 Tax=Nitzschia inconspicua TaxID=303405 RepID=A0A9K3PTR3_9STRA|nr:Sad1 / UNC-like protein [Nitzschia inconspicua]
MPSKKRSANIEAEETVDTVMRNGGDDTNEDADMDENGMNQEEEEEEEVEDDDNENDDNEDDDNENDEDDDDDDNDKNKVETEETTTTTGSPSPGRRRDMHLRSGKRKRARSKETTGLTPPELQKKARESKRSKITPAASTVITNASRSSRQQRQQSKAPPPPPPQQQQQQQQQQKEQQNNINDTTIPQQQLDPTPAGKVAVNGTVMNSTTGTTPSSDASPAAVPDPRRISYAASAAERPMAVPTEQQPTNKDKDEEQDEEQVDQLPPPLPPLQDATATANSDSVTTTTFTVTQTTTKVVIFEMETDETDLVEEKEEPLEDNVKEEDDDDGDDDDTQIVLDIPDNGRYNGIIRLGWMIGLSFLFFVVWPTIVKVSDVLVPLDVSLLVLPLPQPNDVPVDSVIAENEQAMDEERKQRNEAFVQNLDLVRKLDEMNNESNESLRNIYNHIQQTFQELLKQQQDRENALRGQLQQLMEVETLLKSENTNDAIHESIQSVMTTTSRVSGIPILDTAPLVLWNIPEVEEGHCSSEADTVIVEEDALADLGSLVTLQLLREKESDLLLRAEMSAEKFMTSRSIMGKVSNWVPQMIEKAIGQDTVAAAAIGRIPDILQSTKELTDDNTAAVLHRKGDLSDALTEVDEIIEARLEVDQADTTGMIDYASLKNGAEILYGGKRGTSKSLIDYLPLYNRLMKQAGLRFYGFGPEIALTATFPPNALGQCWSFQPASLKEQLEERKLFQNEHGVPDDFKRGSLGTLTIRLPKPVYVSSVVIEHVARGRTDRPDSAVRHFRVVGYEDDAASTKAWYLGAFEYSLQKNGNNELLQEFEVATVAFGKEIPALQSISLAIDSNWGHDYTCLYRFRIHGEEEDAED